jgi:hypothetical protein
MQSFGKDFEQTDNHKINSHTFWKRRKGVIVLRVREAGSEGFIDSC